MEPGIRSKTHKLKEETTVSHRAGPLVVSRVVRTIGWVISAPTLGFRAGCKGGPTLRSLTAGLSAFNLGPGWFVCPAIGSARSLQLLQQAGMRRDLRIPRSPAQLRRSSGLPDRNDRPRKSTYIILKLILKCSILCLYLEYGTMMFQMIEAPTVLHCTPGRAAGWSCMCFSNWHIRLNSAGKRDSFTSEPAGWSWSAQKLQNTED